MQHDLLVKTEKNEFLLLFTPETLLIYSMFLDYGFN